jgi:hypothetical protein
MTVCPREPFPNLRLLNSDFEGDDGPRGPLVSSTVGADEFGASEEFSAAAEWKTITPEKGTVITELLPSTRIPDQQMIRVKTEEAGAGLVQVFPDPPGGLTQAFSWALIFIVSGEVGIGTGAQGKTGVDMVLKKIGSWELLQVSNGISPANSFFITSPVGGAEFYVDSAGVSDKCD